MKYFIAIMSLVMVSSVVHSRSVTQLTSGGSLNNRLSSVSNTSSWASTSGNGGATSRSSASTHGISTGRLTARACPKGGHSSANTSIWAGSNVYASNSSYGGGDGSALADARTVGSSTATSWEQGKVRKWYPRFDQSWTGKTDTKASSKVDTGSWVAVGRNSSAGAKTQVDVSSNASADWMVRPSAFGISDVKHTKTSSNTYTKATSWKQGSNAYVSGWADGSNSEKATANVKARTSNNGWD
jgi:hypothetical protein